ncbi:hypothetical protein OROGR_001446 [Orobanche gracilis]
MVFGGSSHGNMQRKLIKNTSKNLIKLIRKITNAQACTPTSRLMGKAIRSLMKVWGYLLTSLNYLSIFMIGFEDFSILSWNVRGALSKAGQLFIKDMVGFKKPDFVILVETRCQFARCHFFWLNLGFTAQFVEEARGFSGGIWVLKHSSSTVNIRFRSQHRQAISFELWRDNFSWVCTAVYASPNPTLRENFWDHLIALRNNIMVHWMLIGDFNEVLYPAEIRGGDFVHARADRFMRTMEDCRLMDLGLIGSNFTWFRKQNGRIILSKRLDRAMGDVDWRLAFPDAFVETLTRMHSDHCPIFLRCGTSAWNQSQRPFRFLAAWVDHPVYKDVVDNAWREVQEDISIKLERVRHDSLNFNKEVFGNIHRRKRRVEARLKGVQKELDKKISSDIIQHEAALQKELRNIPNQENLFWYQKARDKRVTL